MEPTCDPRVRQVGRVEADDGRCHLAERNPEVLAVRAERHVVRAYADVDAMDDPMAREVDHGQVSGSPIGDVHVAVAGSDSCNLGIAEAVEDLERPERVPAEQRDASMWIDDDGRPAQRCCDHQRVFDATTLQDVTSVRAEGDDENLVRSLGDDDGYRPIRRGAGGRGRDHEQDGGESDESAHATHTAPPCREVP